ncbi:MAG TPA: alpha/beta fold hydrolase [Ktedonobacterales bacterium]|nr:alpha/beta fold hydrolase [Ktedonobacterales bacterium]
MLFHNRLHYARTAATIMGAAAATTAIGTLSAAYIMIDLLTRPQPINPQDEFTFTPWELDMPAEDIIFSDRSQKHMVRAWWIPRAGSRRVVIASSGYRRHRSDLLGIGHRLWQAGNSLLLVDFFGHGYHRGSSVTLAYREVSDLLGAVDYVAERCPDAAIGALGFSMGAAVSIMAAARDERIRAVVADSPFASHRDVVAYAFHRTLRMARSLPNEPILTMADYMLRWRAGYRFGQVEPVREVSLLTPRPLLVIHGTGDETIPYQHSERLYAAASDPKELWLVDGAAHCGAYFDDRKLYCRKVAEFFDSALAGAPARQDKVG